MAQQSKRFDGDDPKVTEFLNPDSPMSKFRNITEKLAEGLARPDGAKDDHHARHEQVAPFQPPQAANAPHAEPNREEFRQEQYGHEERRQDEPSRQSPMIADRMSLSIPEDEGKRVGRPREGRKPKIEKTFAIDQDMYKRIMRISNMDGLRNDARYSLSGVMGHLLEFAFLHVEDDKVMPGPDGCGLHLVKGERA